MNMASQYLVVFVLLFVFVFVFVWSYMTSITSINVYDKCRSNDADEETLKGFSYFTLAVNSLCLLMYIALFVISYRKGGLYDVFTMSNIDMYLNVGSRTKMLNNMFIGFMVLNIVATLICSIVGFNALKQCVVTSIMDKETLEEWQNNADILKGLFGFTCLIIAFIVFGSIYATILKFK